jgi:hypothetical protein
MNMSVENIDNNSDKHLLPDAVIVKRISKNKIKESEEWFSGISNEVFRQGGSMGIDLVCFSGDSPLTDVIGIQIWFNVHYCPHYYVVISYRRTV